MMMLHQNDLLLNLCPSVQKVGGIVSSRFPFYCVEQANAYTAGPILIVLNNDEEVSNLCEQLQILLPKERLVYQFPAFDCLPYDRSSPSQHVTHTRLETLYALLDFKDSSTLNIEIQDLPHSPPLIVTSIAALGQYTIEPQDLKEAELVICIGTEYPRAAFLELLSKKGCQRVDSVYERGEYAVRGFLIDIFPTSVEFPLRLEFFGDTLESIRFFDPLTQKSLSREAKIQKFSIRASHEVLLTSSNLARFKSQYRALFGHHKNFPQNDPFYLSMMEGRPYPGMEHWLPLYTSSRITLLDYITPPACIIFQDGFEEIIKQRIETIFQSYQSRLSPPSVYETSLYNPLEPASFYWMTVQWRAFFEQYIKQIQEVSPFIKSENVSAESTKLLPSFQRARQDSRESLAFELETFLKKRPDLLKLIVCDSKGAQERLLSFLQESNFPLPVLELENLSELSVLFHHHNKQQAIFLGVLPFISTGFESASMVLLSETDILGESVRQLNAKIKKSEAFCQEINQLDLYDLIVHKDHGIGRYLGLKALVVDGCAHDCLELEYHNGDKLFLPVENIELLSKYGEADSLVGLDTLGSSAWYNRKQRLKKRIQIVAEYLIELAAERSLKQGNIFKFKESEWQEFSRKFPYKETDDQMRAILDVLDDLSSGKPMDRLVCGDVGFGKTEVALRAAFMATSNGKQVAIIVPTTLLCRQHYNTFLKRFSEFGYTVAQLSRLVSAKKSKETLEKLEKGDLDIIVGTHSLLRGNPKFHNLGLVIIDEEQRFGVNQKEKLKTLKADVHVLTLTATPIPRTLQLSLSGVRDLSLITTPPLDRLAVRTFIAPFDAMVIREAILREYHRGGQIFYVSPRLEDLTALEEMLKTLVPEVKIQVAHGKLSAAELENVMLDFYDKQFDLLLSTHIVESGIDVPNANTLIIHRSDLFGLAQLYQLRGRVGRAKVQGYAYLTYKEGKSLTEAASKRLKVMQSLDSLGAGFTLASHDLDQRGAGNIVGEEQSGHIKEVGVDLYQTLLQEAILMAKAKAEHNLEELEHLKEDFEWTPQIHLGVPVLIPELYVADLGLRLTLYKRLAALQEKKHIEAFSAELVDRFGPLPPEVINLIDVITLKGYCRKAHIQKIELGPKGVLLSFHSSVIEKSRDSILKILQKPEVNKEWGIKMRPDQKIFFARELLDAKMRKAAAVRIVKLFIDTFVP